MNIENLKSLFSRDLNRLKVEIESYRNESELWITVGGITNSGGNLCLHLIGNLNTYIGMVLGHINYVRDREAEFSLKHIPQQELIEKIDATIVVVAKTLDLLKGRDLEDEFPLLVFEEKTSVEYMLIHLSSHLTYHLGQINYHRRLQVV